MFVYYSKWFLFQIVKNNDSYAEETQITLRGSPENQDKAKELISALISEAEDRDRWAARGGQGRGARRGGNNKRDFSSFPIRKRIDEESAPAIDWDDINRQYVSLIMKVKVYFYIQIFKQGLQDINT